MLQLDYKLSLDDFINTDNHEFIIFNKGIFSIIVEKELWGKYQNENIYRYDTIKHVENIFKSKELYVSHRSTFSDNRDSKGIVKSINELKNKIEDASPDCYMLQKALARKYAYNQNVSCWTLDLLRDGKTQTDRNLMWQSYIANNGCRIGIKLKDFVENIAELKYDVVISRVEYMSVKYHVINDSAYGKLFRKSLGYEDEQEVRIVFLSNKKICERSCQDSLAIKIPIKDVHKLINEIVVSPLISSKEERKIKDDLVAIYGIEANKIKQSALIEYKNKNDE